MQVSTTTRSRPGPATTPSIPAKDSTRYRRVTVHKMSRQEEAPIKSQRAAAMTRLPQVRATTKLKPEVAPIPSQLARGTTLLTAEQVPIVATREAALTIFPTVRSLSKKYNYEKTNEIIFGACRSCCRHHGARYADGTCGTCARLHLACPIGLHGSEWHSGQ